MPNRTIRSPTAAFGLLPLATSFGLNGTKDVHCRSDRAAVAGCRNDVLVATISVRVRASARQDELVGMRDGILLIRVSAPALEGRANESVRRVLAKHLGVPKSSVRIVRGHRSREKVIQIDGLDQPALLKAL